MASDPVTLDRFARTEAGDRSAPPRSGLLGCGVAAGPLFVSVFLIEGATRVGYESRRHSVSSLSFGRRGWVQVANFAATGMLFLAGARGLLRTSDPSGCSRLGSVALAATGIGLLGSAAFRTDPVSGYPPGSPATLPKPSTIGSLHTIAALPIFVGIPAASLACAWRFHRSGRSGWALYSAATSTSMLAGMGLAGAGFGQSPRFTNLAGLFQRAAITIGFTWLTALSGRALMLPDRVDWVCPEFG